MSRTALLAAIGHILHAPRGENGRLADRDTVEQVVDGVLCADDDWEHDDGADLFEAEGEHKVGDAPWEKGGRWYVMKEFNGKPRVVRAPKPSQGGTAGQGSSTPDVPTGDTSAPPADKTPASKKPNKATRLTPEEAEAQIAAFQQKVNVQPSDLKDLANTLAGMLESGLTVEHLKTIARKHASKLTGKKQQLASALAQKALEAVKTGDASKPTDAATTHLQAFQAVKQGQGDAKKFLAGVKKLKAADVKALAAKIGNQKVATKAMGLKVISDAVGVGASGEERPQGEQPKQEKQPDPARMAASVADFVTRWEKEQRTDAPFPELYQHLKQQSPGLTPAGFQSVIRSLHDAGKIELGSWPESRDRMPSPELSFGLGGDNEPAFYVHMPRGQEQPAEPATPSPDVAQHAGSRSSVIHRPKEMAAKVAESWSKLPGARHNQVSLADLKDSLGVSTAEVHSVVNHLRRAGILFAEPIEGGRGDNSRALAAAIKENGQALGYVGVRPEKMEEFKRLMGGIRESHTPPSPDALTAAFARRRRLSASQADEAFGSHVTTLLESGRIRKVEGWLGGTYYVRVQGSGSRS